MKKLGVEIIYNHADYRLASKKVLDELEKYEEVNLFLRGIFPLIGYDTDIVYYERKERFAGRTKYPLKKMLNFSWEGITSFSVKPIRLILSFGIFMFLVSFIFIVIYIINNFNSSNYLSTSFVILIICILSSIQIISIGIVGEYIGKIYSETKKRPRFIIKKNLLEKE